MRDRHQLRLRLLGHQARGSRFLFIEFVLDLIKHFLRFPPPPIQLHDYSGRQVQLISQELILLTGFGVRIIDDAQQVPRSS